MSHVFYFKAYDASGQKRSGKVEAHDAHEADVELRRGGLRPYFVHDYHALKKEMRRRNRRVKIMTLVGAALAGVSLGFASVMVSYAGREQAPDVGGLRKAEAVEGSPIPLAVSTDDEREFALEMYAMWEGFAPKATTSIEVSKSIMVFEANADIADLPDDELEMLATNTVKAHNRRFKANRSTLYVAEDGLTILEIDYTRLTKAIKLTRYS